MRIEKEKTSNKDSHFKSSNKLKNEEHESSNSPNNGPDIKDSHFIRNLRKDIVNTKIILPLNVLTVKN